MEGCIAIHKDSARNRLHPRVLDISEAVPDLRFVESARSPTLHKRSPSFMFTT